MTSEDDSWSEDPQPGDDERVLHGRPDPGQVSGGVRDYAAAIVTRAAAWWAALSDDDFNYGMRRALESASARGAPLHLARCAHHLRDLLAGLDQPDRAWALTLLRLLQNRLATRGDARTLSFVLAYLSNIRNDPRCAPPPALPRKLLQRMYPHGFSPTDLLDALDRHRYPRGKPLPACPLCEPDQVYAAAWPAQPDAAPSESPAARRAQSTG